MREGKKTKEKSKENNYVLIKDTPIASTSKAKDGHGNG